MRIKFGKKFRKQHNRAPEEVRKSFRKRLTLFLKDPFDPVLNNHSLTGKYKDFRSINVTGDWRAIFRVFEKENLIVFDIIGTHSQLYR